MRRLLLALLTFVLAGLVLVPVTHQHPIAIPTGHQNTLSQPAPQLTQTCLVCLFGAPGAILRPVPGIARTVATACVDVTAQRATPTPPRPTSLSRGPPVV